MERIEPCPADATIVVVRIDPLETLKVGLLYQYARNMIVRLKLT